MSDHPTDLFDDYADGHLETSLRRQVDSHLAECDPCRAEIASLRALRDATRALPRHVAPVRDLWQGIAVDLVPRGARVGSSTPLWRPLLAAASIILMIGFGTAIVSRRGSSGVSPEGGDLGAAILAAFDPAEHEATVAEAAILAEVGHRGGTPGALAVKVLMKNINVIDQAIGSLREALTSNPTDYGLVRRLSQEYHRKVALIQQTATLLDQLDAALINPTA